MTLSLWVVLSWLWILDRLRNASDLESSSAFRLLLKASPSNVYCIWQWIVAWPPPNCIGVFNILPRTLLRPSRHTFKFYFFNMSCHPFCYPQIMWIRYAAVFLSHAYFCLAQSQCVLPPPVELPIRNVSLSDSRLRRGVALSAGTPAQPLALTLAPYAFPV